MQASSKVFQKEQGDQIKPFGIPSHGYGHLQFHGGKIVILSLSYFLTLFTHLSNLFFLFFFSFFPPTLFLLFIHSIPFSSCLFNHPPPTTLRRTDSSSTHGPYQPVLTFIFTPLAGRNKYSNTLLCPYS